MQSWENRQSRRVGAQTGEEAGADRIVDDML